MRKLVFALVCVVVLIVSIVSYPALMKQERLANALAMCRLAPFPSGAYAVQVDTEGNLFARSFWVAFKATPQDIQRWVRQSPALSKRRPGSWVQPALLGEQPTWFRPTSIRDGLLYQIPEDNNANYGTVWIDQGMNEVYIKTSHS